jgi:hypothetical protein
MSPGRLAGLIGANKLSQKQTPNKHSSGSVSNLHVGDVSDV